MDMDMAYKVLFDLGVAFWAGGLDLGWIGGLGGGWDICSELSVVGWCALSRDR
jgi:hypothetical protein